MPVMGLEDFTKPSLAGQLIPLKEMYHVRHYLSLGEGA